MSIFNNKNVVKSTSLPLLESFNMDSYGFDILRESEYDSFKISLEFYQTVYTGMKYDNMDIVDEGFTDFFKKAAEFFKNLAVKIMEFAKKYLRYFISFFQDFKKFLEKNSELLRSINVDFEYNGYEFEFPKNTPELSKVHDIISSYNGEINNIENMKYSDINKLRDEFADDAYKNKIRASILNNGSIEVSDTDFGKKSKLTFRKTEEPGKIKVDKSYISNIIDTYGDLKNQLEETEKTKSKIVKLLNDLEYFFSKKASVTYEGSEKKIKTSKLDDTDNKFNRTDSVTSSFDSKKLKILNTYFDLKFRESRFISNCVVTVYTDKVNALKDCMTQYRSIVRKALVDNKEKKSNNGGEDK